MRRASPASRWPARVAILLALLLAGVATAQDSPSAFRHPCALDAAEFQARRVRFQAWF